MHTKPDPIDPDVLEKMGYDKRDLNVPVVRKATIWISAICIICYFVAVVIYNFFTSGSLRHQTKEPVASRNQGLVGKPELQDNITTKIDIVRMRKQENERLENAGIDAQTGKVHIPIEQAMQMVASQGVSTGNEVAAKTTGNTIKQNAEGAATN